MDQNEINIIYEQHHRQILITQNDLLRAALGDDVNAPTVASDAGIF